jgi:hypothetical protein
VDDLKKDIAIAIIEHQIAALNLAQDRDDKRAAYFYVSGAINMADMMEAITATHAAELHVRIDVAYQGCSNG